jgi:hypothetical protein
VLNWGCVWREFTFLSYNFFRQRGAQDTLEEFLEWTLGRLSLAQIHILAVVLQHHVLLGSGFILVKFEQKRSRIKWLLHAVE